MMGYDLNPVTILLPMEVSFTRRLADRHAFIPVSLTKDGMVLPVEYHGSAHISALTLADGIISLPAGKKSIKKGEIVSVRQV